MSINHQIDVLVKGRNLMLALVEGFSLDQINKIPKGFNNNIGWNIAHLVVTQQLLCYQLSGLDVHVSEEMVSKYKKGEDPNGYVIDEQEWRLIKDLLVALPNQLLLDYNNGLFASYQKYTTSVEVTLESIEKAIDFNNFHEGIHLGVVLAIRKLV